MNGHREAIPFLLKAEGLLLVAKLSRWQSQRRAAADSAQELRHSALPGQAETFFVALTNLLQPAANFYLSPGHAACSSPQEINLTLSAIELGRKSEGSDKIATSALLQNYLLKQHRLSFGLYRAPQELAS